MSEIEQQISLPHGKGRNHIRGLVTFARQLIEIQNKIGFKISSRGWAYQLESYRFINKDQFDRIEGLINECRRYGVLPIDFVAEEEGRKFSGVEVPMTCSHNEWLQSWIASTLNCEDSFIPDWWKGEQYYIQMVVEKIDLKTLFEPICKKYKIPLSSSKGWDSMLHRAEYSKRYAQAEAQGLKCVLLYAGDFDPDGLRISDFLRTNLYDLKNIIWIDGTKGYDPKSLIIERFGLDYDFIEANHLTWVDNLITGSGKNLADPNHRNYHMDYLQDYLQKYGVRKCEANAIVPIPDIARQLCRQVIEKYLGTDALQRFAEKRKVIKDAFVELRQDADIQEPLEDALERLRVNDEESGETEDKQ